MALFAAATCHTAAQAVPRLGSAQTARAPSGDAPAAPPVAPAAIRLDSPIFSPVSTVSTLPDLFSAPIKVSEAVLEPYFTFIKL